MLERGWYSFAKCAEIPKINYNISIEEFLRNDEYKVKLIEDNTESDWRNFRFIKKSFLNIQTFDENNKLSKNKVLTLKEIKLYFIKDYSFIIFNTGSNSINSIISSLNKNYNFKIKKVSEVDINSLYRKLEEYNLDLHIEELKVLNYKLLNGSTGNLHLHYIVNDDVIEINESDNHFYSWMKFSFPDDVNNTIEFYSNGSFYLNKKNDLVIEMIKIFVELEGDENE